MQVNHVEDHVTHAIMGGAATIDFGISQSAEFFQILSSTLYSDQIMAVGRETLCNAWDAHIDAGITDKPIEITLTDDKLIIRDYGKGIPHEKIGEIYGTYGNSTKKNDGKQTGGFGLGCKAPFAYTDSFEVVSCDGKMKTVYRLSKSSAEVGGKPGIIPMMTIPNTESGLTVTIAIKSRNDADRFRSVIRTVIRNGDINATLNGQTVETLGFDTKKYSYMLLSRSLGQSSPVGVYIRYGNVIYPVPNNEKTDQAAYRVTAIIRSINSRTSNGYGLLLQAPPHSISVTPSRETLSMQDHTINTLLTMLEKFYNEISEPFNEKCFEYAKQRIASLGERQPEKLLTVQKDLLMEPGRHHLAFASQVTDISGMAKIFMQTCYPKEDEFYMKDVKLRFDTLLKTKIFDEELLSSWFRNWYSKNPLRNTWLKRKVITPLVNALMATGLPEERLYAFDKIYSDSKPTPIAEWDGDSYRRDFLAQMGFVKKQIILSYTTKPDMHRVVNFPQAKRLGENASRHLMLYVVPRSSKMKDKALTAFKKLNFDVLDLTVAQPWERPDVVQPDKATSPKREGMLTLWNIRKHLYTNIRAMKGAVESDSIHAVCYVVSVKSRHSTSVHLNGQTVSSDDINKIIATLYGNRIGVALSVTSYDAQRKKRNLPDWEDYVLASLVKAVSHSKGITKYMRGSLDDFIARHNKADDYEVDFFKNLLKMDGYKQYDIAQPKLNDYDSKLYKLLMHFVKVANDSDDKTRYLPLLDLYSKLSEHEEDEARVVFFKAVVRNPFIKLIDIAKVRRALLLPVTDPQHIAAKAVFDEVMKGMS
jgi:Histidine kinase-, DNA gyrase B-, and HSP90-like ATPase